MRLGDNLSDGKTIILLKLSKYHLVLANLAEIAFGLYIILQGSCCVHVQWWCCLHKKKNRIVYPLHSFENVDEYPLYVIFYIIMSFLFVLFLFSFFPQQLSFLE